MKVTDGPPDWQVALGPSPRLETQEMPLKDDAIFASLHTLGLLHPEIKPKCSVWAKVLAAPASSSPTQSSSHMACGPWLQWSRRWPYFGVPSRSSSPTTLMTDWSSGGCFSCLVQRAYLPRTQPVFVPSAPLHSWALFSSVRPGRVIKKARAQVVIIMGLVRHICSFVHLLPPVADSEISGNKSYKHC